MKRDGGVSPLALNIMKLNAKIQRGDYALEEISCFCGSNDSHIITTKDRYGIFYTLRLCLKCGIMYSSPRLTRESFKKFYQADYRNIYDVGDPRGELTKDMDWERGIENAETIKKFLDEYEIKPKIIFDIGCNLGQSIEVFRDCKVYGTEYDIESIKYAESKGLHILHGGIEQLEALEEKADLIILSHVLEHFSDLRYELNRISKLLAPNGYLYVSVPGLYTWEERFLFQNAHNYQFNTKTLTYIMNCCGWDELYVDAQIKSLWQYSGNMNNNTELVANQAKEIWDYMFSGEKIIPSYSPVCKFSVKERRQNVRDALSYKLKDISDIHKKEVGKDAIIVSGGPSIEDYIEKIKTMQQEGKIVVAIERMYQWCQNNGITPNYVLVMDASDDVIESFDRIHPETVHILATQCKKEIYERLKDEDVYIYSSAQSQISFVESWDKNQYDKVTMINTGGSVSLGCIAISMFLGMKNIHMFGFDCHVTKNNYAEGITGVGHIIDDFVVDIDGREFKTTPIYVSFARQFFDMMRLGKSIGLLENIKLYGDSMAKAMSKIDIDGDKEAE